MNQEEQSYLNLLQNILDNGNTKEDRTGVGTKSIFGTNLRFSLKDNKIPLLTTKKVYLKGIVEELLFFLRGDTNTKLLEEKGVNIWKGNTTREFLDKKGLTYLPEGNMGLGYGHQWRSFNGYGKNLIDNTKFENDPGIDQVSQVINTLKTNPNDRRIIISAWNPSQLDQMALPPCHVLAQFYVNNNKLSCQWYQRSIDSLLGFGFNVASYAILTKILAQTVGMEAEEVVFCGGDTHIYLNHIEQVKLQISREPYEFPTLKINKKLSTIKDIEELQFSNFELSNYKCHPAIKAEMAI